MRMYLDDDSPSPVLARLLQDAGHDVQTPADVGKVGVNDQVHLAHAIAEDRVILTGNHKDFEQLQITGAKHHLSQ